MAPSEGRRKAVPAPERLRRLLVIVPYLVQHPGTELSEVTRLFGVDEEELTRDLGLLFVSGLPPYSPGDLIDVDIEGGRVWIRMADYFARPLRLTRSEALALYLRGTELSATPGVAEAPALHSALRKLQDGLGPETLGELGERVQAAPGGRSAETLETVRTAVEANETLRIEYYAHSSAETTEREIDPEEVFFAIGNWYVAAFDHRSGEERLFRVDRMRAVEAIGTSFEPRGLAGAGRPLYTQTDRDMAVRLVLRPGARWVAEYYEVTSEEELEDGSLQVTLPTARLEWVERLLLRLSGEAEIIEPEVLKDRVRELARRTREPYG